MTIYLDYNATTPIDNRVLDEMNNIYKHYFGNAGSRTHNHGNEAKEIVTRARNSIAKLLNCNSNEVIFTSGATESNNIAVLGLAKWGELNNRKHIISTQIEHKSILEPLEHLSEKGFEIDLVGVDETGRIKTNDLLKYLRADTLLVTVMHANNETGVIQPINEIGELLEETKTYFHVDAAQTFGKVVEELKTVKYDILSISAHKVYGPQGIGALICKMNNYQLPPIQPITYGGGQERGLRPGTSPVALIAGLGKVSEIAAEEYLDWHDKNLKLKNNIIKQISNVEHIINGDQKHCLPHVLSIAFPGVDSEALMLALKNDYSLSNGSACTSVDYQPSHVLTAMGLSDDLKDSTIRISWGKQNIIDLSVMINVLNTLK